MLNMSLSNNAVQGAVVMSRELTIEELTQVGGGYNTSDMREYEEFYYEYDFSDWSFDMPQSDYYSYGVPEVLVSGSSYTSDQQAAWSDAFYDKLNECWEGTSVLEGVAMAVGGTFAEAALTTAGFAGIGETSQGFSDVVGAIHSFNERAEEVGFRFAYCEYVAQTYAYSIQ